MSKLTKASLKRAFTWFESGPVILVASNDGSMDNVMTISWHMVMDFSPHIAITTGSWNESYESILKTNEAVLCVPDTSMIDTVIKIGTVHGSEVNKFDDFGLNKQKASKVKSPLITDCSACLECKLEEHIEAYGILIFKGIQLWEGNNPKSKLLHANGDGTFFEEGKLLYKREMMRQWIPEGSERL
jgi:flavin reductase (DIM6/NTAB) family NADH-FMN oxidoreductase RutF